MYSPCDWTCSNEIKYANAVAARQSAQIQDYTCDVILKEIKARTERAMEDVDKKIGIQFRNNFIKILEFRLNDITFWMDELTKLIKDNAGESKALEACIVRLKNALEATKEPLCLARQCINIREGRDGIDLVADNTHHELAKEIDIFCGIQQLLIRTIEQAEEQLRLNRKSAYNLKRDYESKDTAKNQEELAKTVSSYENTPKVNKCYHPAKSISPTEWVISVRNNLQEGERQIHNSLQLRAIIENILNQIYEDQIKQTEATNRAIRKRIDEIRDSKRKLEENLGLTLKQIIEVEKNIDKIKDAICNVLKAAQIVEAKQNIRDCRPVNERTQDAPYYRMLEQSNDLRNDLSTLHHKIHDSERELKNLRRRQLDLEEEIQLKSNSLNIEEVQVQSIRSSILIQKF
ncbi:unnamed protein product [Hymenolepis diminuta]|uniref:Tektin n=1 Tax=Hymenolepis diminuta TaxID=6216 RepID=A0A0R3ST80_HYMDI|nr:unnamed protein product [Hymenolepis diminuta]